VFSAVGCSGNSQSFSSIPSDGSCATFGGSSGTLTCSGGTATLNQLSGACGSAVATTGTGAGDGNTCIPMTLLGNPVFSVKVNCNSAFLSASLSMFAIILAILVALFFQ